MNASDTWLCCLGLYILAQNGLMESCSTMMGQIKAMLKQLIMLVFFCTLAQHIVAEDNGVEDKIVKESVAEDDKKVTIALGEWPPFIGEKLPGLGAISRIVISSYEAQGYQVSVGFFPWKRSFELTRLGTWDATAVWVRNPERERAFVYSDAVMVGKQVLFYRKDKAFDWKSLEDLERYIIGGSTGYYHGAIIDQGEKTGVFTLERIPDEAANFKKLLMGRVDLVVANKDVGYYLMNEMFNADQLSKITHHRKPLETATYHLIIGKKTPRSQELINTFNLGLAQVRSQ
jgi:polar amino acid transport system substrate-binding protein